MKNGEWTIAQSVAAWQIAAFCSACCQELGLHMVTASWERGFHPLHAHAPYHLVVHTTKGVREWWFTAEEIAAYPTQAVATTVQGTIRAGMANLLGAAES